MGDIHGIPDTVIQVTSRRKGATVSDAIRNKPLECEQQRINAGATFAATFLRLYRGEYRVVLTLEQYFTLWREAQ